jgi:hypothetical protein
MSFAASLKGRVLFDADDEPLISGHSWYLTNGYAKADNPSGKGKGFAKVYMHRLIMGAQKGVEIDHINGNRLDNRRANLRACFHRENARNKSGVSGITWVESRRRWAAQIAFDSNRVGLGYYKTAPEASAAYRIASALLHGRFSSVARNNIEHIREIA